MFRDGFAQMELATFERTISSVTVVFNAYSPNGLLYFRGSETSGDFIALYLKNGHVVFKVSMKLSVCKSYGYMEKKVNSVDFSWK
ncbi:unnamed protein product [Nippostrongylus brasiliensis]|uniref:LAM_G_DOMAIN domain-containing protein n=1 Tax=Nippostrongylus brasiliensis TaxID=27835 RepID=A0A0N4XRZ1_NIPBR|nr:unnamed protein product [Nippostrongylus brasiliensis]